MPKLKVMALLHDPLHKQILIHIQKIGHEEVAKKIIGERLRITFVDNEWEPVKTADHIASPMSRILIRPNFKKNDGNFREASKVYYDELKFIDIFKGKEEDAEAPIEEISDSLRKIEEDIVKELKNMIIECKIPDSVINGYIEDLKDYLHNKLLKFNTEVKLPELEVKDEYLPQVKKKIKKINNKINKFNKQLEEKLRIFESLDNLLKELEKVRNEDIIFLFLWRFLPEIFPWINKHPAEGRAPNHSIYDHSVQTSAVVSALPKPAFLLFTISPVQEFISKARKTSDLWAGSYMLSYLIYKCIEVIMEKLGPDSVMFPNLLEQPLVDRWLYKKFKDSPISQSFSDKNYFKKFIDNTSSYEKLTIANFPNRFLAIIPYDENNSLAKEVEKAFRSKLEEISKEVLDKLSNYSSNSNLQYQIENHLLNYFQAYWVVLPWITNPVYNSSKNKFEYPPNEALEDYGKLISNQNKLYQTIKTIVEHPYYKPANVGSAYSLLLELTEKLLGARKSIRNVLEKNYYESRGEKCHLCGEFEVLDISWDNLRDNKPGLVKKGERLCGVCITKRLFPEIMAKELLLSDSVKFPSTSETATIGEKRRLNDNLKNELKNKIEPFLNKYHAIPKTISVPKLKNDPLYNIDGQFLMEETYRVDYFEKEYGVKVSENDFKDILETLREYKINPSKYYAVLQMDGDNMGKWLKGEFNPKIKDTIHTKVVDALISYSEGEDKNELEKLLRSKHPNSPSIHQAFSRRLSQFALEEVRKIVEDEHYGKLIYAGGDDLLAFLPIEEVLKCAYDLQITFKEVLSPKASMSAGIVIVHYKYPLYLALKEVRIAEKIAKETFEKDAFCIRVIPHSGEIRDTGGKWELIKFIEDLICKFKNEEIPSGFAKEFSEVYESEKIENKELLKVELKRIYFRKRVEDEDYINKIIEQFENYNFDVKYFVNLFSISRFLTREVRL